MRNFKFGCCVALLFALALPLEAEEKVWYCEMTAFSEASMDGAVTLPLERFSMKVTPEEIIFSSQQGWFENYVMYPSFWEGTHHFKGNDGLKMARVVFTEGSLNYSFVTFGAAYAVAAVCEDF